MKTLILTLILLNNLFCFESFNNINKKYNLTSELELKNSYFTKISLTFIHKK